MREGKHTEVCFSRVDEFPDSVETALDNENPLSTPVLINGKVPTNCSSEGVASGFQTTFEEPLARDGSKRASKVLCARAEENAEDMYQLDFELKQSPATESACCRKTARDFNTTSLDYTVDEHRPKCGEWDENAHSR